MNDAKLVYMLQIKVLSYLLCLPLRKKGMRGIRVLLNLSTLPLQLVLHGEVDQINILAHTLPKQNLSLARCNIILKKIYYVILPPHHTIPTAQL